MEDIKAYCNILWEYYPLPLKDFKMIILSFCCWSTFFIFGCAYTPLTWLGKPHKLILSCKDDLDVRNRLPAILNGLFLFLMSGNLYYRFPGGCGDVNTAYEQNLVYFAVGYFVYDFWAMVWYGLIDI